MTASKHVTIWCDREGRDMPEGAYPPCWSHIEVGNQEAIPAARRGAKAAGWRRIKGEDVCPACVPYSGSRDGAT